MRWSNLGRIGFGFGYLAAALFNLTYTLSIPQPFDSFVENAQFNIYKEFLLTIIIPNSSLFILLTVVFEFILGVLILNKLLLVKIGLVVGVIWSIFLVPLLPVGPEMLTNIILATLQAILLRKDYESTFLESLCTRMVVNLQK